MSDAPRFSVVGLGKLGACMAAAIAERGHEVVGVDVNPAVVADVCGGRAPVMETGLQATIDKAGRRMRATTKMTSAIAATDVTFVVVPTPSDPHGAFSIEYVKAAFSDIGRALAAKTDYHLVVLSSTVLPGASRYGLLPILEEASGKQAGRDFGFCYSPEFIALGSVIRDFLNPDFLLVGELDERSGRTLEASYAEFIANDAMCKRMSIENAELAKIALNSYVTMKISFANLLATLCDRIPGGDVDVVTAAIGADRRIGPACLRGGLGYGGPCFPRDNIALGFLADQLGVDAAVPRATDQWNRELPSLVLASVEPYLQPGARAAVLGVAYKPLTSVIEESQGLELARMLEEAGLKVVVYDPLAGPNVSEAVKHATVAPTLETALEGAQVILVCTPDPAFAQLPLQVAAPSVIVVDVWRTLDLPGDVDVVHFGRGDRAGAEVLGSLWSGQLAATPSVG